MYELGDQTLTPMVQQRAPGLDAMSAEEFLINVGVAEQGVDGVLTAFR